MNDFLTFRKFITPVVIQILFWIGVAVVVISGLVLIVRGGSAGAILGLLYIVLGPIFVRIYMEVLIIIFRLYDSVKGIEHALTGGARPAMPGAPMGGAYGGSFGPSAPAGPPQMMPAGPPQMPPAGPPQMPPAGPPPMPPAGPPPMPPAGPPPAPAGPPPAPTSVGPPPMPPTS